MLSQTVHFTSTCGVGSDARFLKDGWIACDLGEITIDMIKKRAFTSLKVAGKRDSTSVLPTFEVRCSVDNVDYWYLDVSIYKNVRM